IRSLAIGTGLSFDGTTLTNTVTDTDTVGTWFTPDFYNGTLVNSTSTALWLKGTSPFSLIASSTFATYASSSQLTTTDNTYLATAGGNVGVGTTNPSFKLDVSGKINTDQYSGYYQNGRLLAYASSTNGSTVLGYSAGGQSATTSSGFILNTAIGYQTLNAITTASKETAVGASALQSVTSGGENTAVGYAALSTLTTGFRNTSVGEFAGTNNVTGRNNVYFGYAAGSGSGSGDYNTFIGTNAGSNVTTGYGNTLLGGTDFLANNLSTGGNNIALGFNTFFPSGTGNNQLNIGGFLFGTIPATTTASAFQLPTAGSFSVGSSSPFSKFAIQTNNGDTARTLFAIGSSTASATSTLFSISNIGTIQSALGAGALVSDSSGVFSASSTLTVNVGGTGSTTSLGGILRGNGSGPIQSVTIGSGLSFDGTTLTNTVAAAAFPFTPLTNYAGNTSATTTALWAQAGIFASSSSAYPTLAVQQAGAGPAATFLGGNVGIGLVNPSYKLDVVGFVNTDQYSGYKQAGNTILYASTTNLTTLVGVGAGSNISAAANYSSALGYQALTTATSSQYNTAIGYQTLANVVDLSGGAGTGVIFGGANTALGYKALTANTSGSQNTALGYQALTGNTTGYRELAVGYQALSSATLTGTDNVALGYQALLSDTVGGSNTAVGNNTLSNLTTGSGNVALGFSANFFNIGGSNNVSLGYNAAYGISSNYTNSGSVAIGYQSGYNFFDGSDYNTLIGYQAGYAINTGTKNIVIGADTALNGGNSSIDSGSGNIQIGNDLTLPSGTGNNALDIGNLIFGSGLDGTGRRISSGKIGIASSTLFAKFGIQANNGDTGSVLFAIGSSTASATSTLFSISNTGAVTLSGLNNALLSTNASGVVVATSTLSVVYGGTGISTSP
ncbi:MAG: hypothetical protein AAB472_03615, partial [Patescibacteria group bacterium]